MKLQSKDDAAIRLVLGGLFVAARVGAVGPNVDRAQVRKCLELAGVVIDEFFEEHKEDLERVGFMERRDHGHHDRGDGGR